MRLDAAIADATQRLADISDSARLDTEILLCLTIDMPRSYLFAHPEDELDELTKQRFEALLQRRLQGEPMSYISGIQEFWSRELIVSPGYAQERPGRIGRIGKRWNVPRASESQKDRAPAVAREIVRRPVRPRRIDHDLVPLVLVERLQCQVLAQRERSPDEPDR